MKGNGTEIRWRNLIALALVVFAVVVGLKTYPQIAAFLSSMKSVGPGGDTGDRTFGLMAFGLIVLTIVAVVRILKDGESRGQ